MPSEAATLEEALDNVNKATVRKHWRRIMDYGLGDEPGSALPGLLADLRANAAVYADARPKKGR